MKQFKLFSILNLLSDKQIARLKLFVESSYFNANKAVSKLLELVLLHRHQLEEINNEEAKQRLFGLIYENSAPYNDTQIRLLMSDLVKLIEKFIKISEYEKDEDAQALKLLDFFQEHRSGYFESLLKDLEGKYHAIEHNGTNYYYYGYKLAAYRAAHQSRIDIKEAAPNFELQSAAIDHYYFREKLKFLCLLANLPHGLAANFDEGKAALLLNHLECSGALSVPVIRAFYLAYQLIINKNAEQNLEDLLYLLQENSKNIASSDLQILYYYAQNFCSLQLNKGKSDYYPKLLSIYKKQVEYGLLLHENKMVIGVFKNIATVALRLKEFEWVRNFVERHIEYIPQNLQSEALHLSMAQIYFDLNQLETMQEHLWQAMQAGIHDLFYKLTAYRLRVKLYYTRQELDLFESEINKFRVYLAREKHASPAIIESNRHFVNFIYQIYCLSPTDKTKLQKLQQNLTQTTYVSEREWLISEAGKLMG